MSDLRRGADLHHSPVIYDGNTVKLDRLVEGVGDEHDFN